MPDITHMHMNAQDLYLEALKLPNLTDLARRTGRGYRTLVAYRRKEFMPSAVAIRELAQYLREEAEAFLTAAERLEAVLTQTEEENE